MSHPTLTFFHRSRITIVLGWEEGRARGTESDALPLHRDNGIFKARMVEGFLVLNMVRSQFVNDVCVVVRC